MTLTTYICTSTGNGHSQSIEFGIGQTFGKNEANLFYGNCKGFSVDQSVGVDVIISFWKNLDAIKGRSYAATFGGDIPGSELGASKGLVFSDDMKEVIGATFSIGAGVGLSPIDLTVEKCDTKQLAYVTW